MQPSKCEFTVNGQLDIRDRALRFGTKKIFVLQLQLNERTMPLHFQNAMRPNDQIDNDFNNLYYNFPAAVGLQTPTLFATSAPLFQPRNPALQNSIRTTTLSSFKVG